MLQQQFVLIAGTLGLGVAFGAGLWLALPVERLVAEKLGYLPVGVSRTARFLRVIVWAATGYLISLPFVNLVSLLQSISLPTGTGSTDWGIAPAWVSTAVSVLLMLATYAVILFAGRSLGATLRDVIRPCLPEFYSNLILLSGASLVWGLVRGITFIVLHPQIPALQATAGQRGLVGFLGSWMVALFVVLIIGLYHNAIQDDPGDSHHMGD